MVVSELNNTVINIILASLQYCIDLQPANEETASSAPKLNGKRPRRNGLFNYKEESSQNKRLRSEWQCRSLRTLLWIHDGRGRRGTILWNAMVPPLLCVMQFQLLSNSCKPFLCYVCFQQAHWTKVSSLEKKVAELTAEIIEIKTALERLNSASSGNTPWSKTWSVAKILEQPKAMGKQQSQRSLEVPLSQQPELNKEVSRILYI